MRYFEGDIINDTTPLWVSMAIGLGYLWRQKHSNTRRIGLLSVPFDTELAGLIALGALRFDLECPTANNIDAHFEFLLRKYREYTSSPALFPKKSWDVRNITEGSCWCFVVDNDAKDKVVLQDSKYRQNIIRRGKRIPNPNGPCIRYITRKNALSWQLYNQPLPEISPTKGTALEQSVYNTFPGCNGTIFEDNLRRSYAGLVMVGQAAGRETNYMKKFYSSGFICQGRKYFLGELLTLHPNGGDYIRRLKFINERASNPHEFETYLVVADGVQAIIHAAEEFPKSDIIGICNRSVSFDTTVQLRAWLDERIRYYVDLSIDDYIIGILPEGMLLRILQQKGT